MSEQDLFNDLSVTGVCCGLTVSESGEGMSWILLLLLSHAGVSTTGTGGMSWILSSMLHTGVSAVGTDGDRGGEYCIVFTVCKSINSSFTEYEAELLRGLILIFCSFDKVANLAKRLSLEISIKSLIFVICLYILSILLPFFQTLSQLIQRNISLSRLFNSFDVKYDVAIVILLSVLVYL